MRVAISVLSRERDIDVAVKELLRIFDLEVRVKHMQDSAIVQPREFLATDRCEF